MIGKFLSSVEIFESNLYAQIPGSSAVAVSWFTHDQVDGSWNGLERLPGLCDDCGATPGGGPLIMQFHEYRT